MLSYRSMKKNKTINEDIGKVQWSRHAPIADENELPSKTQLKAEADAKQALGVRLCELPKDKVLSLALPEALEEAVLEYQKMTANVARKRHRQYIGKLMREVDCEPIEAQLERWDGNNQAENARFHAMEKWRTRLIEDADALTEFLTLYPDADRQALRNLIRNAQKEAESHKSPKASRDLFKLIRSLSEAKAV